MNVYNYLLGENHVYTGTSCKTLYHCMNTDSEGILGSLNASFITYLGTLVSLSLGIMITVGHFYSEYLQDYS